MSFSLLGILMLEALQEFSVSGMDSTGGAAASELSVQQTNRNGTRTEEASNIFVLEMCLSPVDSRKHNWIFRFFNF